MITHVPTPWIFRQALPPFEQDCGITAAGLQNVLAETFCRAHNQSDYQPALAEANAAFIVTACNAYEADQRKIAALVDALTECADVLGKLMQSARIEGRTEAENYARHGNEVARDALVLAKGE